MVDKTLEVVKFVLGRQLPFIMICRRDPPSHELRMGTKLSEPATKECLYFVSHVAALGLIHWGLTPPNTDVVVVRL